MSWCDSDCYPAVLAILLISATLARCGSWVILYILSLLVSFIWKSYRFHLCCVGNPSHICTIVNRRSVGHIFCGGLSISFRNHTDQNSCLTPSFFPVLATLATGGESYSSSSCLFSYFSSTRPVKSITKWLQDNLDPGSTFPPSNSNRVAVLEAYDDYPDNLAILEPEI